MDLPLSAPSAPLPPPFPSCTDQLQEGQLGAVLSSEQLEGNAQALVRACVGALQVTEVSCAAGLWIQDKWQHPCLLIQQPKLVTWYVPYAQACNTPACICHQVAFATSSALKYLVLRLAPGTTQAHLQVGRE
jgi:hypothetical protein